MAQDKRFSVIIPLYKKNYETLEDTLHHLKEQDYKNFELIFVHNSPDDKSKEYVQSPAFKKLIKPFPLWRERDAGYDAKLGNGNHCKAFNHGAAAAIGDYLLFWDPDICIYPGILREYKDAFDQNPDVDFVYGDYDFDSASQRVSGRTYNEYELKCANYISGAFPIKKAAFKGWDESVKSLQDWDMWLSAVDAGAKGFYLQRPCFKAATPTAGGISADSATNWIERWTYVRTKHGFPPSKVALTSLGAPYHATKVAEVLGADTRVYNTIVNHKPHDYETIYLLGFYIPDWMGHMSLFYKLGNLKEELSSKKRVIHWIGTDIFRLQHQVSWMALQNIKGMLTDDEFSFVHLTECEETQKELLELGIPSDVVPLPVQNQYKVVPFPKDFTVGVYINPGQDMYHEEFMYEVAKAMPDVKFKFFGNPNRKEVVDNMEWVGWVDMEEFLPTISAMVRLTQHDGLPIGPIEAMMSGRNVLASIPLKHAVAAKYVGGNPDLTNTVTEVRELEKMPLNVEGSKYWSKEVSPDLYKKRMAKYL